jgi:hypothetical protein
MYGVVGDRQGSAAVRVGVRNFIKVREPVLPSLTTYHTATTFLLSFYFLYWLCFLFYGVCIIYRLLAVHCSALAHWKIEKTTTLSMETKDGSSEESTSTLSEKELNHQREVQFKARHLLVVGFFSLILFVLPILLSSTSLTIPQRLPRPRHLPLLLRLPPLAPGPAQPLRMRDFSHTSRDDTQHWLLAPAIVPKSRHNRG